MCNWGYFAYDFAVLRITFSCKYICSNFNVNVLQKNGFCRFIYFYEPRQSISFVATTVCSRLEKFTELLSIFTMPAF